MKRKIIVGSRESKLAVLQTQIIIDQIERANKDIQIELKTMKTTGDKILDKTLDKIGGKGLFIKELERALIDGEIDISVHSLKDMPSEINEDLPLVAYSNREDPRDVLILPQNMDGIDYSKPLGSSSERRKRQLITLDNNLTVKPVRGNVLTRLEKLDRGEFSALVLAMAGVKRISLENRVSRIFSTKEVLPASGQGILAIQGRKDENYDFLKSINNQESEECAFLERQFIRVLDGGCSSPIGAYAEISGNEIKLTGYYVDLDTGNSIKDSITADRDKAKNIGEILAKKLLKEVN